MTLWDFLTIWGAYLRWFVEHVDWMVVFGAVLIGSAVWMFIRMARDPHSAFDFAQMFEGDNGKTALAKFLSFIGGWTSTWVVVAYAARGILTDTMFSLYLGILVAGKVASEFVASRKPNGGDHDVPDPPQPTSAPAAPDDDASTTSAPSSDKRPWGKRKE